MHDMACKQTSSTAVTLVNVKICCLMTHDLHSAVLVCSCLIFQRIPARCTCLALLHLNVMLNIKEKPAHCISVHSAPSAPRYLWPSLLPCILEICPMSNSGMQMGGARGSHRCTNPLCCLAAHRCAFTPVLLTVLYLLSSSLHITLPTCHLRMCSPS